MDPSISSDVVIGGVLAALVLALWRDVRSLGERVARLERAYGQLPTRADLSALELQLRPADHGG